MEKLSKKINRLLNLGIINFFKCDNKIYFSLNKKFKTIGKIFNLTFYTHYWHRIFRQYFKHNDVFQKVQNLKTDLDEISLEYLDMYVESEILWNRFTNLPEEKFWSEYDKKLFSEYKKIEFKQPYSDLLEINPYIAKSVYGLKELPQTIFDEINGKDIIDAGALKGDTAYVFHKNFSNSKIYAFEPISVYANTVKEVAKRLDTDKIEVVNKGLGDENKRLTISFNGEEEQAEIIKLDDFYNNKNSEIGLIKCDTEGFETLIINGAINSIKKYKPVLAISIYHTPEDFFDLKNKIKEINPNYRFMIRRSEDVFPIADLILIAY